MGKILGLITARGGSKGIPQKNIRDLAGKPLLAWTIEVALSSQCFDKVVVSTDDYRIAKVARDFGADVPFMRPFEMAQDDSSSMDAVLHAVHFLANHENYFPQYIMLLQPTSPLRSSVDIQKAIKIIQDKQADSVVSVTTVHQHPYWMKTISPDGRLADFSPTERSYTKRQDLPTAYALNGAIYLARREVLLARSSFYGKNTFAYVMPSERSLDIDTPWEFHLAELILKDNLQHESN
ncbi:MAG: acylneuraminate cytidylyltransferase family protein [Anaerolineales bacterium]|nr:acylneuraminate cytidylyltransferase family protein [Anaerolineales bacterium]